MRGTRGGGGWRNRVAAAGIGLALTTGLALAGCGRSPSTSDPSAPRVVVLSEAHRFMAQRIGGDAVGVGHPELGSGRSPDQPPRRDAILAMQAADRLLVNGMGAEPWLEKVSLPEGKVVVLGDALQAVPSNAGGIAHRHGPTGVAHRHAGVTLPWLDLKAAAGQAEEIRGAITELLPDQGRAIQERAEELSEELNELDQAFQATAARLEGLTFLMVGDDLAAFSHRYGLEAVALLERPDGESELFLQELDHRRGGSGSTVLLLTSPLPPELGKELTRRGVMAVVLEDGLAHSATGDFPAMLRFNLESLRQLLPGTQEPRNG